MDRRTVDEAHDHFKCCFLIWRHGAHYDPSDIQPQPEGEGKPATFGTPRKEMDLAARLRVKRQPAGGWLPRPDAFIS